MATITRTQIDFDMAKRVYDLKESGKDFTKAAVLTGLSAASTQRIFTLIDAAERGENLETVYPKNYNNLKRFVSEIFRNKQPAALPDNTAQCLVTIIQLLTGIDEKLGKMCRAWSAEQ